MVCTGVQPPPSVAMERWLGQSSRPFQVTLSTSTLPLTIPFLTSVDMEKYIRENGSMTKCLISKRLGSRKGNYLLYHEATFFTIYTQYSTYLGCPFHLNRVVQSWVKKTKWRKTEGDYEEISACLPSTNRAKASRSLQFSLANIFSTTWATLFSSQPLLAGANLLSYVHGLLSLTQEIGPNS